MKSLFSKKLVAVSSVLILIVAVSLIVAFTVGNVATPSLSEPDGVFYERTDDNGEVIYEITNKELYDHIRSDNGLNQLRFLLDNHILQAYIADVENDQDAIDDKKLELTYGTADQEEIADMDQEAKDELETTFEQQMYLAGYGEDHDLYAIIALARENYTRDAIARDGLTASDIADHYTNRYFDDIRALRIRFTSESDARDVLASFNVAYYEDDEDTPRLGRYLGYVFEDESLIDDDETIVEAYETVFPYYYDDDGNLLNLDAEIVYTAGETAGTFTDEDDNTYSLDENDNLIDADQVIAVENERIFDTLEDATAYKEDNTTYYDVHKVDPFDEDESVKILSEGTVLYTIEPDGTVYDQSTNDVTDTFDIIINKIYTPHDEVEEFTPEVVDELTDEEVLTEYIKMYNYVYGEYRDLLPVWHVGDDVYYDLASVPAGEMAERVDVGFLNDYASDRLDFSFDEVTSLSSGLADYMFSELDGETDPYTGEPKDFSGNNNDYHYMVYRFTPAEDKTDVFTPMFDLVEQQIVIPDTVAEDIELPKEGLYGATIEWTIAEEHEDLIDDEGAVTNPDEDTEVSLTYKITLGSETRTGAKTITILAEGENADVTVPDVSETPIDELIGDETDYQNVVDALVDDELGGDDATETINNHLADLYTKLGVEVFDYHLALDYASFNSDFEFNGKGDRHLLAKVDGYIPLDSDDVASEPFEVTPDRYLEYTLDKNAALYVINASRAKEIIHSVYYEQMFGTQTDITKNNSDMMDEIQEQVNQSVQYYNYLKQVYSQYGITYPYDNFIDYAYAQYGTFDDEGLREYFVISKLQPYFVNETLTEEELIEKMYPTVQEYFNNYFSLDVNQVVIYLDRDEDGSPDDYTEFYDELDESEAYDLDGMLASFEDAVNDYLDDNNDDFDKLTETYAAASREDETWGTFKQYGFMILNEELSMQDQDDQEETHSLHYSGEYGVKDRYVQGFVDALVNLYKEYTLPQNNDLEELYSPLVDTEYGLHVIRAQQGENFDQPVASFTDENDAYADGLENDDDMPTLDQLRVYTEYYMYDSAYDLSEADAEERYGIDVPDIPADLANTLDFYFGDILKESYVLGTLNINIAGRLDQGNFFESEYTDQTEADLKINLSELGVIYYDALFGAYIEE